MHLALSRLGQAACVVALVLLASDGQLQKAIQARFARSKIAVNRFQVHVRDGVATIEGRTAVPQHKGTATRLAKSAGAVKVINKVEVDRATVRPRARVIPPRQKTGGR